MLPQRKQANAVTYGCMLDSCVKCGDLQLALQVFEDVKKEGKHRNTVLYTTLIKGCSKQKDLQSALALFREMKQEQVPYNTITYNSIIDVCVNCGAVHLAEGIFQQMIHEETASSGSPPDLITFSTLLKGYCQAGELDKAFMVIEAIRERRLPCDELVYNTLIDGCVKTGDLSTGLGLFDEMLKEGARPSTITHSILVKLYRCAGYGQQSPEAVAVLYQHHGLQPPVVGLHRRRESGRRDQRQGPSPHNVVLRSKGTDLSAAATSPCSSPESMASMPQTGLSWDQACMTQMNFAESQSPPMHSFAQHLPSGPQSTTDPAYSSAGWNTTGPPAEVQNIPMPQGGSLLIMGPYPAPVPNVCAPAPGDSACSNAKTKTIIKI
jgi:pentatricopeptide repeat protein